MFSPKRFNNFTISVADNNFYWKVKTIMGIRLILVCKEGPARQAYFHEANAIGVEVDCVATFGELFKAMLNNAYQGVMVDVVTSIKASREEKGITNEILKIFPLIQLRWNPETNKIHTITQGTTSGALTAFVEQECRPFQPRAIRLDVRKAINFNVLMCKQENMNQADLEQSVVLNISKGGCFLLSCRDWSNTSNVWFEVKELNDKTPIQGEIQWRQLWGKAMVIPGFGIRIKQMTSQQLTQLREQYFI